MTRPDCPGYWPGHHVHRIQARQFHLRAQEPGEAVAVEPAAHGAWLLVSTPTGLQRLWGHDADRLRMFVGHRVLLAASMVRRADAIESPVASVSTAPSPCASRAPGSP